MTDPESDARRTQIDEVVREYVRRKSQGEAVDQQQIVEKHPELMPELASELARRRMVAIARKHFEREHARRDPSGGDPDGASREASPAAPNDMPVDMPRTATELGGMLPSAFRSTAGLDDSVDTVQISVRCPNCGNSVSIMVDVPWSDITCIGCGQSFSLVADGVATRAAPALKQIAHFELIERIGVGGFGTVWKARDTVLDRVVALKLPRHGQLSEEEVDKFLREARAAAQLRHPAIVSVHEVGRTDETVYIVTDLVRGVLLNEWAAIQSPTPRETAELMLLVARALEHAHQAGVVHRDLKPGNIMVDRRNLPHIMDFGLAKRDAGEVTVTIEGQVLGTPAYMAPEQARGEAHLCSPQTDVYSLGVVLFELLTGSLPFRGNTSMLVHQVLTAEPPKPRSLNNHIPADLETVCLRCLEKDPSRRFADGGELAAELERFLQGEPIHSRPVGPVTRAARWCRRNVSLTAMAGATVLALILGTAVSTYFAVVAIGAINQEKIQRKRAEASRREASESREQAAKSQEQVEIAKKSFLTATDKFLSGGTKILSSPYNRQLQSVGLLLQETDTEHAQANALRALEMLEDPLRCSPSMHDYAWRMLHRLARARHDDPARTPLGPWSTSLKQPTRLEFSPNHATLAVVDAQSIRLLDTESGHEQTSIPIDAPIVDLAWSFDSVHLAYCQRDGVARLIRLRGTGQQHQVGRQHVVTCVAFRQGGQSELLLGTKTGAVIAMSTQRVAGHTEADGDGESQLAQLDGMVTDLDQKLGTFAVAGSGHQVVLLRDEQPPETLNGHSSPVRRVVVARNATFVLSAGENGEVLRWRIRKSTVPELPVQLCSPGTSLRTIDVSADNKSIATVLADRVQIWDARTGEFRVSLSLSGGESLVTARFGPHPADETHWLAVLDGAHELRFWNGDPAPRAPTQTHYLGGTLRSVACLASPPTLVGADSDRAVHFLDLDQAESRGVLFCRRPIRVVQAADDRRTNTQWIAAVLDNGQLDVFQHLGKGEWRGWETFGPTDVAAVRFFADGSRLLRLQKDGALYLDSLAADDRQMLAAAADQIRLVTALPSGKAIVAADASGRLVVWTRSTDAGQGADEWRIVRQLDHHLGESFDEILTLDADHVAVVQADGRLTVHNPLTGQLVVSRRDGPLQSAATHSGTGRLAFAVNDTIHIWQFREGRLERLGSPHVEHQGAVVAMCFTADGKRLISTGADRAVNVVPVE